MSWVSHFSGDNAALKRFPVKATLRSPDHCKRRVSKSRCALVRVFVIISNIIDITGIEQAFFSTFDRDGALGKIEAFSEII
jgi:hypothetical protein